jgi:hypothetical protein
MLDTSSSPPCYGRGIGAMRHTRCLRSQTMVGALAGGTGGRRRPSSTTLPPVRLAVLARLA